MKLFTIKRSTPSSPKDVGGGKLEKLNTVQLHLMAESELMFAQAQLAEYHNRMGEPSDHLNQSMVHMEHAHLAVRELLRRVDGP